MSTLTFDKAERIAEEIRVKGLVQGVGFRPTVLRLAKKCGLTGTVLNDGEGVLIQVSGARRNVEEFLEFIKNETPPLARIDSIERTLTSEKPPVEGFRIVESRIGKTQTNVVADTASCRACLEETFNILSRRYRYPFTNCTHCGPRFSIVRSIPYDRCNTSMANFKMCGDCKAEYTDPLDRRFHAQPIACNSCGPKVWLEGSDGRRISLDSIHQLDEIDAACALLEKGEILAIKGMGGFHLACDATNEDVLERLRERKGRYQKPFALMASNLQMITRFCRVDDLERSLLESPSAPIVLLNHEGDERLPESVAPGLKEYGFMLPYMPLHHLILKKMKRPIVLTSGNFSEEPQCIDNREAHRRLKGIADYFLFHDRDIINRLDDSVLRVIDKTPRLIRRARGTAPEALSLPSGFESALPVLALGGELKNTFCLIQDGQAILSQYIGDLKSADTFKDYQRNIDLYSNLFQHRPTRLVVDRHPEYLSTRWGRDWAQKKQLVTVQHHHAHVAACLAENKVPLNTRAILGVALDGLGYGDDDALWGGEILLADYREFKRLGSFKPVALLGGSQAMKEPWRNTLAQIFSAMGWENYLKSFSDLELTRFLKTKPISTMKILNEKNLNSPKASSVGRLFDAVAAAVGICRERVGYEGQAAMQLEAVVDEATLLGRQESGYSFTIVKDGKTVLHMIDPHPMWLGLFHDLRNNTPAGVISARFHIGLAHAISAMVKKLTNKDGKCFTNTVALSGGVFQNRILLERVIKILQQENYQVLTHSRVPANDGGISLGQAMIAAARGLDKEQS